MSLSSAQAMLDDTGDAALRRALRPGDRCDMVIYDLETTVGSVSDLIEFGCVTVDKRRLFEKGCFSTLIYSDRVTARSVSINGITQAALDGAPHFDEVADEIYRQMHGKIWLGWNIDRFDNRVLATAFERAGRVPPQPYLSIDLLPLVRRHFGKRAGDLKMRSLGRFYELGEEAHRSLDDCRMTLDVFKNVCVTLFLESWCDLDLTPSEHETRQACGSGDAGAAPSAHAPSAHVSTSPTVVESSTHIGTSSAVTHGTPARRSATVPAAVPAGGSAHRARVDERIVRHLDRLMTDGDQRLVVDICYAGGSQPHRWRPVQVLRWVRRPYLVLCMCLQSNSEKHFTVRKIEDIAEKMRVV